MKQLLCFSKSSQWKQPTSVLFYQTRPPFPDSVTEKFHTNYVPVLTTCHCYWLPTRNRYAKWGEVRSPVPCFSSGKPFNLTSFFKSSAENFILLLSWENQGGHATQGLCQFLYFKSLFIIISHHLLLPCFKTVAVFTMWGLAPSLALNKFLSPLLSHQSHSLTSSFLLICKSFPTHQIPSSTTKITPSSYHSVSFLPQLSYFLTFFLIQE